MQISMDNDDKDLYKVAEEYVYSVYDEIDDFRDTVEGFVAGAKWDRKNFLEMPYMIPKIIVDIK